MATRLIGFCRATVRDEIAKAVLAWGENIPQVIAWQW
jgi:hypothetical protein